MIAEPFNAWPLVQNRTQRLGIPCVALPFASSIFTVVGVTSFEGPELGVAFSAVSAAWMIFPSESRGLRAHPVFKPRASLKRGKICASVLKTTESNGRRSLGENRR